MIGTQVRRYEDPNAWDSPYDVGVVRHIEDGWVYLDFYDWIERVPVDKLVRRKLFLEGYEVLIPLAEGEVVERFHQGNSGP